jgi:hypothetical protein
MGFDVRAQIQIGLAGHLLHGANIGLQNLAVHEYGRGFEVWRCLYGQGVCYGIHDPVITRGASMASVHTNVAASIKCGAMAAWLGWVPPSVLGFVFFNLFGT